jgi:hypothetical protein
MGEERPEPAGVVGVCAAKMAIADRADRQHYEPDAAQWRESGGDARALVRAGTIEVNMGEP